MIPLLGSINVQRIQRGAVINVNGHAVAGGTTTTTIRAAVQSARHKDKIWLPDGYGIDNAKLIISYSELSSGEEGGRESDLIIFEGKTYTLVSARKQPKFSIQPEHWEAVGVELQGVST